MPGELSFASCAYGRKRKKEFAFLLCHVPVHKVTAAVQEHMFACQSKESAQRKRVCHPAVAGAMADCFQAAEAPS